jgi:hypothetical protein
MQIYIFKNSQQLGPFTLEQVRCKESSGELLPTDLARLPHEQSWRPLESFTKESLPATNGAKNVFIRRGELAFGPYSLEEVKQYVAAGNILHSDEARAGNDESWQHISSLLGIAPPPPRPTAAPPPPGGSSPDRQIDHFSDRGVWVGFAITSCGGALLALIGAIMATRDENRIPEFSYRTAKRGEILEIVGSLVALIGYCLLAVLLYRLWRALRSRINGVRPGQAAGFMFIPFFNLYWQFIALRGLAVEMNRAIAEMNLPIRPLSVGLATSMCILMCFAWLPGIGLLATVAWAICGTLLVKSMLAIADQVRN